MALTDEHVLAAYVEGFNNDAVAPRLRDAFKEFAASGSWPTDQVLLVDLRQPPDPTYPDDLPQWDLGLNLGLDHLASAPNWFAGVESLVKRLLELNTETSREFVLFLCSGSKPGYQEHLVFVDDHKVDLPWLREAIEHLCKPGK